MRRRFFCARGRVVRARMGKFATARGMRRYSLRRHRVCFAREEGLSAPTWGNLRQCGCACAGLFVGASGMFCKPAGEICGGNAKGQFHRADAYVWWAGNLRLGHVRVKCRHQPDFGRRTGWAAKEYGKWAISIAEIPFAALVRGVFVLNAVCEYVEHCCRDNVERKKHQQYKNRL